MKKILVLFLSLCCVASLAACSQSDELPEDYSTLKILHKSLSFA